MKQMFSNKAYDFRQNLPIDLEIQNFKFIAHPMTLKSQESAFGM